MFNYLDFGKTMCHNKKCQQKKAIFIYLLSPSGYAKLCHSIMNAIQFKYQSTLYLTKHYSLNLQVPVHFYTLINHIFFYVQLKSKNQVACWKE